jgi:hypothetical protein
MVMTAHTAEIKSFGEVGVDISYVGRKERAINEFGYLEEEHCKRFLIL